MNTKLVLRCLLIIMFSTMSLYGKVSSTSGNIFFDVQSNGQAEARLNTTGLGLGIEPTEKLHVNGNAIVTQTLTSANLELTGAFVYAIENVTTSQSIDKDKGFYLVNTNGAGNIVLSLPEPSDASMRTYLIKKTYSGNSVALVSTRGIDGQGDLALEDGDYVKLMSDGSSWYTLSSSNSISSDTTFSDNLQLYLSFNSDLDDHSVNGSSISFNGNIYNDASVTGRISNALDFDGVDDYIEIDDANELDVTNQVSFSFWVKPSSNTVTLSNYNEMSSFDNPSGVGADDPGNVSATIVGNVLKLVSFQFNGGAESNEYTESSLNFSGINWTDFTSNATGSGGREGSSMVVKSDGNTLYFAALAVTGITESFYTGTANLDFTNFSGWADRNDPDGGGGNEPGFMDMIIVDERMYFASYLHDGGTENLQLGSANLNGDDSINWVSVADQPAGAAGGGESSSVSMVSDAENIYYAMFATSGTAESLYFGSSNLDGTGFARTGIQNAPDGVEGDYSSYVSSVLIGNSIHYGIVLSNSSGANLYTAYSDKEYNSLSSWVLRSSFSTEEFYRDSLSLDMLTTGENIVYVINSGNGSTATELVMSTLDIEGGPIFDKEDAYSLHYNHGGLTLEWAGARHQFGNLTTNEFTHVGITHDGSILKFYIDGAEVLRQATPQVFSTSSSNLKLGGDGNRFFNGSLDDFRMYDRALDSSVIQELSNISY